MKEIIKRGLTSFALSSFAGLLVNLLFPSPTLAAYVNILLYGVIGATFALAAYIYELERIGFVIQSIIYFIVTSVVCVAITTLLWQLHKYPAAFICTLIGYAATHVIMITIEYRRLRADIKVINELSNE